MKILLALVLAMTLIGQAEAIPKSKYDEPSPSQEDVTHVVATLMVYRLRCPQADMKSAEKLIRELAAYSLEERLDEFLEMALRLHDERQSKWCDDIDEGVREANKVK